MIPHEKPGEIGRNSERPVEIVSYAFLDIPDAEFNEIILKRLYEQTERGRTLPLDRKSVV
jgi:hypothetical protein